MSTLPEDTQPVRQGGAPPERVPVLTNGAIALAAVVLAVVGAALVTVLLLFFGGSDHQAQHEAQLDAIKTAGTIVVGTGGAAALWLTARRQRTTEIGLNQKAADQAAVDRAFAFQQQQAEQVRLRQERFDAAAEADAEARRITEQYGRAVDQLGSDKAAVRLGGLYALERLAQENPGQRATIVAVICAYLRMPYQPPGDEPVTDASPEEHTQFEARTEERQVRLTAQDILATHLRPGSDPTEPVETFWPDTTLDLTGATLIDLDLSDCYITARFERATFDGIAGFDGTTFAGDAQFGGATFDGIAGFGATTFASGARFGATTFAGGARFGGATFDGPAWFGGATFDGGVWFRQATFAYRPAANGWVRLHSRPRDDVWPPGWSVVPSQDRPDGVTEGEWGQLVEQPEARSP